MPDTLWGLQPPPLWKDRPMARRERAGPAPVEAPRIGAELADREDDALDDGAVLDGIDWAGGAPSVGASDVEIAGSRLAAVRLTGLELDQLRLVDVVADGCELSGGRDAVGRPMRARAVHAVPDVGAGRRRPASDARALRRLQARRRLAPGCVPRPLRAGRLRPDRRRPLRRPPVALPAAGLQARRRRAVDATFDDVALHGSSLDGARGAGALRGVVIGRDQVLPLALAIFGPLGITVDDDYLDDA